MSKSILALATQIRDGQIEQGVRLSRIETHLGLTTTLTAQAPAKVKKAKAKREVTETEALVTSAKALIAEIDAENAPLVRCTTKTKATGKRCKVMSKSETCGLHRRAAEIAERKAVAIDLTAVVEATAPAKVTGPVTKKPFTTQRQTETVRSRKAWNSEVMAIAGKERREAIVAAWPVVQEAFKAGMKPKAAVKKALAV